MKGQWPIRVGVSIVLMGIVLTGCAEPVFLRHPQTGHTVQCGPFSKAGFQGEIAAAMREARCIDDYQRQGYERAPK